MLQHINVAAGTTRAAENKTAAVLTPAQISARIDQLGSTAPASEMISLINSKADGTPQLISDLNVLLQQEGDDSQLLAGLTQLLAKYGEGISNEPHAIKDLAHWLGAQVSQESRPGNLVEKQSLLLLRQLSQGNLNDPVKNTLVKVLQDLRLSGGPLVQDQKDDKLQTLLHQVKQELNSSGLKQDPQLGKNLTEFALRLHQQLSEGMAQLIPSGSGNPIVSRREDGQSRQPHHGNDEEEEPEEIAINVTGTKKIVAQRQVYNASVSSPVSNTISIKPTSVVIGSTSTSSSTQVSSGVSLYQGDSVFSYGLNVLFMFMQTLSDQANNSYAEMQKNSTASRDAQGHASTVDGILANVAAQGKASATGDLPDDVKKYIEDNHLEISGICGFDDTGKWAWSKDSGYDQGQLTAIKGALDNVANRASDFISTSQLQLQKMMQTYNVCVSLINSLQTMLADMNKTIAQGIR